MVSSPYAVGPTERDVAYLVSSQAYKNTGDARLLRRAAGRVRGKLFRFLRLAAEAQDDRDNGGDTDKNE